MRRIVVQLQSDLVAAAQPCRVRYACLLAIVFSGAAEADHVASTSGD